jgi:hypothetical protein
VVAQLAMLARPRVEYFHPANGEPRSAIVGAKLKAMGVWPGVPDLCLIADGRIYMLELKKTGARLSPTQKETMYRLEQAGAVCAVACGLDAAIKQLGEWGLLRDAADRKKEEAV